MASGSQGCAESVWVLELVDSGGGGGAGFGVRDLEGVSSWLRKANFFVR